MMIMIENGSWAEFTKQVQIFVRAAMGNDRRELEKTFKDVSLAYEQLDDWERMDQANKAFDFVMQAYDKRKQELML